MLDHTSIGAPGTNVSPDEQVRLAGAVRESRKRETLRTLRRSDTSDLIFCPSCGDRTILLDEQNTYVVRDDERICAACGAERDFVQLYRTDADIGGEGAG